MGIETNATTEEQRLKNEFINLRAKLNDFSEKLDNLEDKVLILDTDFRRHEKNEKVFFKELLELVMQNSKSCEEMTVSVTEVKESVKTYVELQEDITVMVRFIKKLSAAGVFIGKFIVIFGVVGTGFKYIYDNFIKITS